MSTHIAKVKEMLQEVNEMVIKESVRILKSGCVDKEKYNDRQYALAKLLLISSLRKAADKYQPHKELCKDLKNMEKF